MIDQGFTFDLAFTSVLKRAIRTLVIIQEAMELEWIPVTRAWQLNERSYGRSRGSTRRKPRRSTATPR
jgi:2,3-bisphosphoglycerate-dependent phosphoglycerate mutase